MLRHIWVTPKQFCELTKLSMDVINSIADKILSNVPSTMKSLEESHVLEPIDHNIIRRGRRR